MSLPRLQVMLDIETLGLTPGCPTSRNPRSLLTKRAILAVLFCIALLSPIRAQHLEERPFGTWFSDACTDPIGRGCVLRFFEYQGNVRASIDPDGWWVEYPTAIWFSLERTYQTGPEWICPWLVPCDLFIPVLRGSFPIGRVPIGLNVYAQGGVLLSREPDRVLFTQGVILTR